MYSSIVGEPSGATSTFSMSWKLLYFTHNPLKIRPKSFVVCYWTFAPYFHPSRSNRSLPPFRTQGHRDTLVCVPSIPYCGGECLTCLLISYLLKVGQWLARFVAIQFLTRKKGINQLLIDTLNYYLDFLLICPYNGS